MLACKALVPPAGSSSSDDVSLSSSSPNKLSSDSSSSLSKSFYHKENANDIRIDLQLIKGISNVKQFYIIKNIYIIHQSINYIYYIIPYNINKIFVVFLI